MKITRIEADHKIQLPADWANELGLEQSAILEKMAEGILVRPWPKLTWEEIFADKLQSTAASALDLAEVSGDDLLF